MKFDLLTTSEACDMIRRRLLAGWTIVTADGDGVQTLEECIYTPGTPDNADFEAVGFSNTVYLARKTEGLRRLLKDPLDFNEIQVLTFGRGPDGSPGVAIDSFNPDVLTKEDAVSEIVARARAFLESGTVRGRARG